MGKTGPGAPITAPQSVDAADLPTRVPGARRTQFFYLSPSDLLIPRVDRQCTMQFCEAVAQAGVEVEVVSLDVRLDYDEPTRDRNLFEVYGVAPCFRVTRLPSRARQSRGDVNPVYRTLTYASYILWSLLVRRQTVAYDCTTLYLKNYLLAFPFLVARRLLRGRVLLLFEVHVPPARRFQRWVLRHVDGVVAISGVLALELRQATGLESSRVLVAHQGVNLELIESLRLERHEARSRLNLPADKKLAVYTGKVYDGYGEIDLLLEAARRLPDDVQMIIVGGREDQVSALRERSRREGIENVCFTGFVAPAEVFHYQMAADVLLSYYPEGIDLNDYRSPGKLFEYMAARSPIVTADYRSLHEVLSDDAALFIEKDNPEALATAIERVAADEVLANRLARQAYLDVQDYTWRRRAERVIAFAEDIRSSTAARGLSK